MRDARLGDHHTMALDDDDAERTLAAALAFVEQFELAEDRELARADEGTAALDRNGREQRAVVPSRSRRRTSTFDPNRARAQGKKELLYLRNKVRVLDAELAALKSGEASSATSLVVRSALRAHKLDSLRSLSRGGRMPITSPPRFVWEDIAARQYAGRQKAEMENLRLRAMLEGQIKIAQGLESLLKKRSSEQVRAWRTLSRLHSLPR